MRTIDSHCHLQMDPLFQRAGSFVSSGGLSKCLVPSYDPEGWSRQSSLSSLQGVSLGLGLHPWCLENLTLDEASSLMESEFPKLARTWGDGLVAVGEFGLDRARPLLEERFEIQVEIFKRHLNWSKKLELPLIVHSVRAHGQTLELLEGDPPSRGGVLHSYSGPPEMLLPFSRTGMYFGFSPALAHSRKHRESLKAAETTRILFESDLPSGNTSDTPMECLAEVVRLAAEILDMSEEWCWSLQRENCKKLFGI